MEAVTACNRGCNRSVVESSVAALAGPHVPLHYRYITVTLQLHYWAACAAARPHRSPLLGRERLSLYSSGVSSHRHRGIELRDHPRSGL